MINLLLFWYGKIFYFDNLLLNLSIFWLLLIMNRDYKFINIGVIC